MSVVKRFDVNREQVTLNKDFINVNLENNHETAYSSSTVARNDVPAVHRKAGLQITYLLSDGWYIDQYLSSDVSGWEIASNWKFIGPIADVVTNPEWLSVTIDKDRRIIEGITSEGKKKVMVPVELKDTVETHAATIESVSNPEYIEVKVDTEGRLIEAINKNGEKIFGVIPPQIKQYIDENMYVSSGVQSIEYDDTTGDMYATYNDKSGVTDVYMEPNGDIYVESEE